MAECPHAHSPNESVSPSRTSGSPTGSRSDSVETAASQLAPVLRPASGADSKGGVIDPCTECIGNGPSIDCDDCVYGL